MTTLNPGDLCRLNGGGFRGTMLTTKILTPATLGDGRINTWVGDEEVLVYLGCLGLSEVFDQNLDISTYAFLRKDQVVYLHLVHALLPEHVSRC